MVAVGPVALLCCLLLYRSPSGWFGTVSLLTTVILYASMTHSAWRGKTATRIAGVAVTAVFFLLWPEIWSDPLWRAGLTQYRSVVVLLFGIALLQRVLKNTGIDEPIRVLLHAADPSWTGLIVMALAMLLALPLSLATVAILTGILTQVVKEPLDGARLSMRVVSLTMFLIPTTVASAAVSASIPDLHLVNILILGVPLFVFGLFATSRVRPQVLKRVENTVDAGWLKWLGIAFVTLFATALAAGAAISEAVGISGLGLFVIDVVRCGQGFRGLVTRSAEAVRACSSEILLMFACGMLACALARVSTGNPHVAEAVQLFWCSPGIAYGVVIVILPAITIFGIHPLILFNLLFPIVDNSLLGTPAAQYIAWVSMFIGAQLLSPVSISAVLAASSLGISPAETSYRLHYGFVLILSIFVWVYLTLSHGGRMFGWIPISF